MKAKSLSMIVILSLILFSSCSNLQLQEFDGISFNNSSYHLAWDWKPTGGKLKDKIQIYLENYDSSVDYVKKYDAIGFEGDIEHVFLYFNQQLYVKDDYDFPNISNEATKIQKIVFYHPNQILPTKEYLVLDNDRASLFVREYRSSIGTQYNNLERLNLKEYEVGIYIPDYFSYYTGISIGTDNTGHFGMIDHTENVPRVRLFSNELNTILGEKLK